jgi:predicted small secreted protein
MFITICSSIIIGTIATTTIIIITVHVSSKQYLEYSRNKNLHHVVLKVYKNIKHSSIFLEPFTYDKNKNVTTFFAKRIRMFYQFYCNLLEKIFHYIKRLKNIFQKIAKQLEPFCYNFRKN